MPFLGEPEVLHSASESTRRSAQSRHPATNKGSERALRPCAVFRKITNGFRTEGGAKLYADIRSIIETARRRAIGALEAIRLTMAGLQRQ